MDMRSKLLENFVAAGESYVSFVEILRGVERGDYMMPVTGSKSIVLWAGMQAEAVDAINSLVREGVLSMSGECSILTYMADGEVLTYPVAKSLREYKKTRWIPAVFNKGANWPKAS